MTKNDLLKRMRLALQKGLRIGSRPPVVRKVLRALGRGLLIAANNANNYDIRRNGEGWLIQKLAPHTKSVIDVGANHGGWAQELLQHSGNVRIYCVEPIPQFAQAIRDKLGRFVYVIEAALSDEPRDLLLYKVGGGGKADPMDIDDTIEPLTIQAITGDELVRSHDIRDVSMIKVDADGFDFSVVKGFCASIDYHRPIVQFEYSHFWIATGTYLRDAFQFFEFRNYRIGRLIPKGVELTRYSVKDELFLTNNFVAIPKEKLSLLVSA